ncbi:unnamed protein product, partial [Staurois parvus]
KPTTVKSVCICSKACLLYSLWNLSSYHVKTLFDSVFFDPPLLPVPPSCLLIRHIVWSHSAHAQFSVYC